MNIRLSRVKELARKMQGDPRSVFYGDVTVSVDSADAADAIGQKDAAVDVVANAIANDEPDELVAANKLAAYDAMSVSDRTSRTLLPALACWNAIVIINPQLGKVLATALDYMLLRTLNDFPYEGKTLFGVNDASAGTSTITINSQAIGVGTDGFAHKYVALPFFRFTIAASTLNAAPGSQISIDIVAQNAEGRVIDTAKTGYTYAFQRISNTEAVVGVFIPTLVVSTRTLPFLPVAGDAGAETAKTITITFRGIAAQDRVSVTIPGYATAELKEISAMYNLPAGMIR